MDRINSESFMTIHNSIIKRALDLTLSLAVGATSIVAANAVIFLNGPSCSISIENATGNDVHRYAKWIEHFDQEPYISVDLINRWLAGDKVQVDSNDTDLLTGIIADTQADLDGWKRPFRCVRNHVAADGRLVPVGVYSFGEDGHSTTEGNDPDDLNSWRDVSADFYGDRANRRTLWAVILLSLLCSTPIYLHLQRRRGARAQVST